MISAARKTAELRAYVDSLDRELVQWREAADGDDAPLRRHYTQIEAIAGTLSAIAAQQRSGLDGHTGDWVFESAQGIEQRMLDLHRLWGFFRDRLALRYVRTFADALLVADDLAWACYKPAQDLIPPERRREPPLLYFSGASSPHLMPRGTPYAVTPLPDGGLTAPRFTQLVDGVPIALIGLPWFQVEHVPDLPVVAHEVGHAVEADLALEADVERLLLDATDPAHAAAWRAWRQEVFADLYGVLGLGPAYAVTLASLLAAHPRDVTTEAFSPTRWGPYPTRTLRVLLVSAALREIGFEAEAEALTQAWRAAYPTHVYAAFERDVQPAATAILGGCQPKLGCQPLTAVLCFDADQQTEARLVEAQLAGMFGPAAAEGIRTLVAGARLAYEAPGPAYDPIRASQLVRARAKSIQTLGRRVAKAADEAPPDDVRAERDQRAGRQLAALLDEETITDVQAQQA